MNALALREDAADPHAPTGFRYRAAKLGPLLGADRLDGTVVDLDPGEGSEPYHYVYGREEWLLVLTGTPTLRHPHGEDRPAVTPGGEIGGNDMKEPHRRSSGTSLRTRSTKWRR